VNDQQFIQVEDALKVTKTASRPQTDVLDVFRKTPLTQPALSMVEQQSERSTHFANDKVVDYIAAARIKELV